MLANEKPIIRDLTNSMWRRVRLVPFVETVSIDDTLRPICLAEAPGDVNFLLKAVGSGNATGSVVPAVVNACNVF